MRNPYRFNQVLYSEHPKKTYTLILMLFALWQKIVQIAINSNVHKLFELNRHDNC